MAKKTYNTPKRKETVKTYLTEEEKMILDAHCRHYNISRADYIRQAIFQGEIRPVIKSGGGEEELNAISSLTAECRRIGNNLNQIARHFNAGYPDTWEMRQRLLNAVYDLNSFCSRAEGALCKLYGNL